ncbi:hypothetical protein PS1_007651 [Malus domestica]
MFSEIGITAGNVGISARLESFSAVENAPTLLTTQTIATIAASAMRNAAAELNVFVQLVDMAEYSKVSCHRV